MLSLRQLSRGEGEKGDYQKETGEAEEGAAG